MSGIATANPQRVLTALGFERPDVPPLALSLAMQAGRTTGVPLPEILRDPQRFADAQLQMHERWQHDIAVGMMYAAAEAEALGAEVTFYEDGPPNVASMLLEQPSDLLHLPGVDVRAAPPLAATLEVIARMKSGLEGRALVCAVAVGPLSGPVLWMGMERWIEVLMTDPGFAADVVARYREFALAWAAAQLESGGDVLVWFEPLASTTILPLALIEQHAGPTLRDACGLGAPLVLHLASARAVDTVDLAATCGATVLSIGLNDDAVALRQATAGKLSLIGPLDGIGMHHWSAERAGRVATEATGRFGADGGFVLCDAHGEIPWQVAPETIDTVVRATRGVALGSP